MVQNRRRAARRPRLSVRHRAVAPVLRPRAVARGAPRRPDRSHRGLGTDDQRGVRPTVRRGAGRGSALGGALPGQARWPPGARGPAGGGQGGAPDDGTVVDAGVAHARRRDRCVRPSDHRADPSGRRHHPRPGHHTGVLLRRVLSHDDVGHHPQPVEHRLRPWRLVRRHRRRPRRRLRAARHRERHRWVDPHPGVVQRRRRLQATVRSGAGVAAVQPRPVLPRRPARPQRCRHGPARERDRRLASPRRRVAAQPTADPCAAGGCRRPEDRPVSRPR